MNKQHILDEIRRTATENGGQPLGTARFEKQTGIRRADWLGRYWARWGDALKEAGLSPNQLTSSIDDDVVIGQLALFILQLGHFPVSAELRIHKRSNIDFPSHSVFERFGGKSGLIKAVRAYCSTHSGFDGVDEICRGIQAEESTPEESNNDVAEFEVGYVYLALMKIGREKRYKIGKADIVGRRTKQIAVQLPEDLELIHTISTDDAYGIEAYWHRRFAEKRRGGEWFDLSADDVRVFRRRKFM